MLKKLFNLIKRIVISAFVLYGYNLLVTPINLIIPINIVTVSLLTIFGLPALFSLIIILIVVF